MMNQYLENEEGELNPVGDDGHVASGSMGD